MCLPPAAGGFFSFAQVSQFKSKGVVRLALSHDQVLQQLILQFVRALEHERNDRWTEIDLATQIYRQFGYPGIQTLAGTSKLDTRTLMEYVCIGDAFAPTVRAPYRSLSYTHFRCAVRVAKLHPNEVGADPVYWVREALKQGWSSKELMRQGRIQRTTPNGAPSVQDTIAHAHQQIIDGHKSEGRILAEVARHNAVYGPFLGKILQVTLVDYVPVTPVA